MQLTLIAPTPSDICAFGARSISAYLKSKGHKVKIIFLPTSLRGRNTEREFIFNYPEHILGDVLDLVKGSDLVGVSLMTNYFDAAVQLTKNIKKIFDVPVLWGGAHPTVKPEECLDYADMVCIGEGEEAVAELLQTMSEGKPYHNIRNLWVKNNGDLVRNNIRPLIKNLDDLPFFDFDLKEQYVIDIKKNRVVELDAELFKRILPRESHFHHTKHISFKTYSSRGCPHRCSYCINDFLKKKYPGQKYLRTRSVENIITELEQIKEKFPFIETIVFFDDTMLVRSSREISDFSEHYKKKIGLPLHIQVSPTTINKAKMASLIDAGLVFVEMGIQTASENTKELYQRKTSNDRVIEAANIIHGFQPMMLPPCYHVILDNPWESAGDVLETLRAILRLPRPFWLKRASLVLFPGTVLYDKAKRENLIRDEMNDIYRKNLIVPSHSYVNFLIYLAGQVYFPRSLVLIMSHQYLVAFLNRRCYDRMFALFQSAFEVYLLLIKGFQSLFSGDIQRIAAYLRKRIALI